MYEADKLQKLVVFADDTAQLGLTLNHQPYWFKRKTLGWGWEPDSSKGCIAFAVFLIVDAGGTAILSSFSGWHPWILIWSLSWLVVFLALVVAKGEPLW